jgi:2',3'-cyclic-nucleotide 2'-phosphodiesterase (5'-nucleotidase family)
MLEQRRRWDTPMVDIRRRTVTLGLAATAVMPPRFAWAESAKLTLVLTNDIYQMGETAMPDGKRRGGFARLGAVVKAERAKGGAVLFAHGGDTLSPSLMADVWHRSGPAHRRTDQHDQAGHLRAWQS